MKVSRSVPAKPAPLLTSVRIAVVHVPNVSEDRFGRDLLIRISKYAPSIVSVLDSGRPVNRHAAPECEKNGGSVPMNTEPNQSVSNASPDCELHIVALSQPAVFDISALCDTGTVPAVSDRASPLRMAPPQ